MNPWWEQALVELVPEKLTWIVIGISFLGKSCQFTLKFFLSLVFLTLRHLFYFLLIYQLNKSLDSSKLLMHYYFWDSFSLHKWIMSTNRVLLLRLLVMAQQLCIFQLWFYMSFKLYASVNSAKVLAFSTTYLSVKLRIEAF